MNSRTLVVTVSAGIFALFVAFEYGQAQTTSEPRIEGIGIVSIRNVLNNSEKRTQYRAQVMASQSRARAELKTLAAEVETAETELTTLREGTADYLDQLDVVLEKRARLEGKQEYFQQMLALEDKQSLEKLYQETLQIVEDLAKEKGLSLVLERTEPEFPVSSEEFMMTFSTHKVIYGAGCVDLTAETLTRLDATAISTP
jgi:Skp family chaperone for outer membrane proteins